MDDATIRVVSSVGREGWTALVDPPGEIPSGGNERALFASGGGAFTTGFWKRDPDTWTFERSYDEVALILQGEAEIETDDGRTLAVAAGDVLITPKGSKGTWRIHSKIVKFWAVYDG